METKSTSKKQENFKNGKVRFCLNIDVRKEKEDSWLNAIKTKIAYVKGGLNFRSKSTANVRLMESVLDNHRAPTQSVCVADFYFIVNVLDLPFTSPIAIYR